MSTEQGNQAEPVETQGDGDIAAIRADLQKAIEKRQNAKAETAQAMAETASMRARLDEFEAEKKAADEQKLRDDGESQKLLAIRDAELEAARAETAGLQWDKRFVSTAKAVATETGLDSAVMAGMLLLEQRDGGADVAPDDLSADTVAGLIDMVRKRAPSLFEARNVGGTPGVATNSGGQSKFGDLAKRLG